MRTLSNLFRWAPSNRKFISETGEAYLSEMILPLGYLCHFVIKLWKGNILTLEVSPGDEGTSSEGTVASSVVIGSNIRLLDFDAFLSEILDECLEDPLEIGERPRNVSG